MRSAVLGVLLVVMAGLAGCAETPDTQETPPPATAQGTVDIAWEPALPGPGDEVRFSAVVDLASGDAVEEVLWTVAGKRHTSDPTVRFQAAGTYSVSLQIATRAGHDLRAQADVEVRSTETQTTSTSSTKAPPTSTAPPVGHVPPPVPEPEDGLEPHVIVAVADTGINPYHEMYHRPERTEHPCTYIEDFPCSIPALRLSVGGRSFDDAMAKDEAVWDGIQAGKWYWIPQTVFVAVYCEAPYNGGVCILDDTHMHGTGTTSSVLSENPDALLAFVETDLQGDYIAPFVQARIPVDIYSISIGHAIPPVLPWPGGCEEVPAAAIYVHSSGNEPGVSALLDCWAGEPEMIQVGGGYANGRTQEVLAYKEPDVVSYYCRPTADTKTTSGMRDSYCGTSFAAPTVAGALSKVILGVRQAHGYTGNTEGRVLEPTSGLTIEGLREAMNRTASYTPVAAYPNSCFYCPPVNPVAPYLQWSWGFYDGLVAKATLDHILGTAEAPDKSAAAVAYMETLYLARQTLYG